MTMRIGDSDIFLSIEKRDPADAYSACVVTAAALSGSGQDFRATHDVVVFDTSEPTRQALTDFQNLQSQSVELPASEDSWLRLVRDVHGRISVRYRVARWKLAAALEGEVSVDGDFADQFCTDLRRFFWGSA